MKTITEQLADALRQAIAATDKQAELLKAGVRDIPCPRDEARDAWREALAAYDAQASRLPTEYRVKTEWDSFEALTPREAASEVWEKIKRSEGPIFTVYGRDGSVTDVDLSEDDYNA